MRWVDYREVSVNEIYVKREDEIPQRMSDPRVRDLAESFDVATGGEPGNCLWVERTDLGYELIAGRDRFAALLSKGRERLWVRLGEFDARGLLLAEVHENLHRRHDDRNALLARLVDETEQAIAGVSAPAGQQLPGRPKTTRQKAREQVAEETGLTPQAVRRAEQKAEAPKEQPPVAEVPEEPPIDMRGLSAAPGWVSNVGAVVSEMELIEQDLTEAKRALGRIAKLGLHTSHVEALRTAIADALHEVEQRTPAAACKACRDPDGAAGRREGCGVCLGAGYVVRSQVDGVATTKRKVPQKAEAGGERAGYDRAPSNAVREAQPTPNVDGGGVPSTPGAQPGDVQHDAGAITRPAPASRSASPANVGTKRPPPRNRIVVVRDDGSEATYDPTEAG